MQCINYKFEDDQAHRPSEPRCFPSTQEQRSLGIIMVVFLYWGSKECDPNSNSDGDSSNNSSCSSRGSKTTYQVTDTFFVPGIVLGALI